nr:putative ribonuclease H-like domain-containing protein [Tanacetum cinerariifolium]
MTLTFTDTHNMVAYLNKSDASEGFNQIIDFLNGSYIEYALTVNPTNYVSCIKQFWNTVAVKQSNDVTRLQALVDRKKVVVTKAAIRVALRLDNAEGVDCLPNEDIFTELDRIGYEKPSTKLTFYKSFFLSRNLNFSKYIFDSLVRNVDSSSKFYMYPRFIQLIIQNQLGDLSTHTTKYISPALTQKVFANMRRVGKGCSGVETPLFEGMLVARKPEEHGDAEEQGTDDNAAEEPATTVLEDDVAQDLEIIKLKTRVKKLERANKVKNLKLRRLRKVKTFQRIESSADTDMKDVSNQGRMIDELDKDEGVVLMSEKEEEKKAEEVKDITSDAQVEGRQADIYQIDMDHAAKVLSMQEDELEVQEEVEVVTTAKLITEVVAAVSETVSVAVVVPTITAAPIKIVVPSTRRKRGVVIKDPEEESSTKTPTETKSKDKGKGIMVEEPKPMKKKQQVELDEAYARKLHEEINQDIDWEVAIDHVKQKAKENPYVQRYQVMKKRPQTEATHCRDLSAGRQKLTMLDSAARMFNVAKSSKDYYSLLEVIINEDSPDPTIIVDGVVQPVTIMSADQKLARRNERKSRGTLLMALPDKHQLKFNSHKDAKTLMKNLDQIHDRLQKLVSQLKIHRVSLSQEDVNLKFLHSLPSEWKTHTLIWRNKANLEEHSLDDLFNSFKIYEAKVRNSSSSGNPTQNLAFVSSSNTDSTIDSVCAATSVSDVYAKLHVSYDWSYQAEKEPANFARMAITSSSISSDNEVQSCSKACSKVYDQLHSQYDKLTVEFCKSQIDVLSYQASLESVKARLVVYKQNESILEENINLFKQEVQARDNVLVTLKQKLNQAEQERDELKLKLDKFQSSSKNLAEFLASQTNDNHGLGYFSSEVPPPIIVNFMPPKSDLFFHIAPIAVETDHSAITVQLSPAKPAQNLSQTTRPMAPIIVDWISDSEDESEPNDPQSAPIVSAAKGKKGKWVWRPKCPILDHDFRTISASMILKWFDYNDALRRSKYVAFGGNPKGGKISGKGKIKTGKLDFEDVYFVKELKFNLFSVLQMCDKKNKVLFTDFECLVLSPDFKLPDENQVLLRVTTKNNMYNVNLKDIVPSGDLTCRFETTTIDESNLWHRRLGHINFKTINKLVKGNLVRGLPIKVYENNNTCVACKKGKQHRASCKTKPVISVNQLLFRLHMNLFGPTFVKNLNNKNYCLVITDDYSRFTWLFFLATKDETSPILKTFVTGLEN